MTVELKQHGVVLISATCLGSWLTPGEVQYRGNKELLEVCPNDSDGCYLVFWFRRAAKRLGVDDVDGDWRDHQPQNILKL